MSCGKKVESTQLTPVTFSLKLSSRFGFSNVDGSDIKLAECCETVHVGCSIWESDLACVILRRTSTGDWPREQKGTKLYGDLNLSLTAPVAFLSNS